MKEKAYGIAELVREYRRDFHMHPELGFHEVRTSEKVAATLEGLGYRVLAAGSPGEAIRLAGEHSSGIHLVLTDVVMPEMNGRDLAEQLQSLYPGKKVLFMSGYTADVIVHRGVLDEGVNFIQKPFSMKDLAVKVQEVLRRSE